MTLTQARKMNLLPSVTTIIGATIPSFGLNVWWEGELLKAAIDTPPTTEEQAWDEKDWKKRVKDKAGEYRDQSAAEGTRLHDLIRHWIEYGYPKPGEEDPGYDDVLRPVFAWLEGNVDLTRQPIAEKVWVSPAQQYAGTVDLVAPAKSGGGILLVDFKSQGGSLRVWDDYPIQLAGYAAMLMQDPAWADEWKKGPLRRISIVFSREQEQVLAREHDATETDRHDRIWNRCLHNWRDISKYWPGANQGEAA